MANKPPAFQFYVKDWLNSATVLRMTRADKGLYIDLLCHAWNSDDPGTISIPDSILCKVCGISSLTLAQFLTKFPSTFTRDQGRLVNTKLHGQWLQYQELSRRRSEAAKQGKNQANAEQLHHSASAFSSAIAINTKPKPRAQTRSARNRFDDEMEQRRRLEAKAKREAKEEEVRRELHVGEWRAS